MAYEVRVYVVQKAVMGIATVYVAAGGIPVVRDDSRPVGMPHKCLLLAAAWLQIQNGSG
jgi:hypothetical protein